VSFAKHHREISWISRFVHEYQSQNKGIKTVRAAGERDAKKTMAPILIKTSPKGAFLSGEAVAAVRAWVEKRLSYLQTAPGVSRNIKMEKVSVDVHILPHVLFFTCRATCNLQCRGRAFPLYIHLS
jgi:hypothetical protein